MNYGKNFEFIGTSKIKSNLTSYVNFGDTGLNFKTPRKSFFEKFEA